MICRAFGGQLGPSRLRVRISIHSQNKCDAFVGDGKGPSEGAEEAERILPRKIRVDIEWINEEERVLLMQTQTGARHGICGRNND